MSDESTVEPLLSAEDTPPVQKPGPGIVASALLVLLTTLPAIGLLYLAAQLLHLPFVPFDLFDWPIRAGFAPWVAFVNTLTGAQEATGGNIAQSAPVVRWTLSLLLFLLIALILGLAFYLFIVRRGRIPDWLDGLMIAILFGAPMIFVSLTAGSSPLPAWISVLWLTALFTGWGLAISYGFRQLLEKSPPPPTDEGLPVTSGIDRRQFLIRFGAGAAAITTLSAAAGAALAPGKSAGKLQATLPMASPEFLEAQRELFGNFRRFAIVRLSGEAASESNVVALGAEYPDRNYVSVWLGGSSPIIVYENLATVLEAYSAAESKTAIYWLDE